MIHLSKEHGLNPTMGVCFLCRQPTNEIGLLGHNKGKKAERYSILSMEPCDKCKEYMEQGVVLVEAKPGKDPSGPPEILGGYAVVRDDAIKKIFSSPMREEVLEKRIAYVEPAMWDLLGLRGVEVNNVG